MKLFLVYDDTAEQIADITAESDGLLSEAKHCQFSYKGSIDDNFGKIIEVTETSTGKIYQGELTKERDAR